MSERFIDDVERLPELALGLSPRLISAGWFGSAACIPIVFFFAAFARGGDSSGGSNLLGIWFFLVFPISIAVFFGFSVGARILDFDRKRTPSRAMLRGMLVAICSYLAMPASFIIVGAFASESEPLANLVYGILLIFGMGAVLVGWLVVIAGGAAGLLLLWASGKEELQTIIKTAPRVSAKKAYLLIGAAGVVVLLINISLLLLPSLLSGSRGLFFRGLDRLDPIVGSLQYLVRLHATINPNFS
jgi:hypothetical protein